MIDKSFLVMILSLAAVILSGCITFNEPSDPEVVYVTQTPTPEPLFEASYPFTAEFIFPGDEFDTFGITFYDDNSSYIRVDGVVVFRVPWRCVCCTASSCTYLLEEGEGDDMQVEIYSDGYASTYADGEIISGRWY